MNPPAAVLDAAPDPVRAFRRDPTAEIVLVRRLTADLRTASPRRFLVDIAGSALGGWGALALAACPACPVAARWSAGGVAAVLLYRALMFVHELFHQPGLRGVRHVWHLLVGIPTLVPLLLYQPIHQRHHSADSYGTVADGEYEDLRGRCRRMAVRLLLSGCMMPVAVVLRFAVLAPLAWCVPVVRRRILPIFGHLTMRVPFRAPSLRGAAAAEAARIEVACAIWAWLLIAALLTGAASVVLIWAGVLAGVALLNTLRALGATHLYREEDAGRGALAQVADSVNVECTGPLTRVICPIGLQYHALHHAAPYLPYHAMRTAHRRLMAELPPGALYRRAAVPSLWGGWLRLVRATGPANRLDNP
ncbi:MAG: fatty acid desaturase [Planctomycetes bacterium]|nr:fatty acid desaturase [Planctomycetota bacterium]